MPLWKRYLLLKSSTSTFTSLFNVYYCYYVLSNEGENGLRSTYNDKINNLLALCKHMWYALRYSINNYEDSITSKLLAKNIELWWTTGDVLYCFLFLIPAEKITILLSIICTVILTKYFRICHRRYYDKDKDNTDDDHIFDMLSLSFDKKIKKHSLKYKLTWLQTYYDILLTKHCIIVMIVFIKIIVYWSWIVVLDGTNNNKWL